MTLSRSIWTRHWWRTDHQPGHFIYMRCQKNGPLPGAPHSGPVNLHSSRLAALRLCRCMGCIERRFGEFK